MKKTNWTLLLGVTLFSAPLFAQTSFKETKAGHEFFISLPDYMTKASGINSASTIQFKNIPKDVYGFVIMDTKEDLDLAQMHFNSASDFYEFFIKDFLKDQENRTVSAPKNFKKGDIEFIESDISYFDKSAKGDIYYYACIVQTKKSFYKVLCYTGLESKEKYRADFKKIAESLHD